MQAVATAVVVAVAVAVAKPTGVAVVTTMAMVAPAAVVAVVSMVAVVAVVSRVMDAQPHLALQTEGVWHAASCHLTITVGRSAVWVVGPIRIGPPALAQGQWCRELAGTRKSPRSLRSTSSRRNTLRRRTGSGHHLLPTLAAAHNSKSPRTTRGFNFCQPRSVTRCFPFRFEYSTPFSQFHGAAWASSIYVRSGLTLYTRFVYRGVCCCGTQREGVLFGVEKGGRCLIGDEMGLGKTLQGIAIAWRFRNEWPLLVLAPASMTSAWANEIEKVLICVWPWREAVFAWLELRLMGPPPPPPAHVGHATRFHA